MDVSLTGQVAFVCGGAENIGGAISRQLAELGADVGILDIKPESANQKAEEIRRLGRRAIAIEGDGSIWANVQHGADATYEAFGRLDIAVNVVGEGIRVPSFFDETEDELRIRWRAILRPIFSSSVLWRST